MNITWRFRPTGDLETDLAEQRRVGRLAGRLARQLPPPTTAVLRDRLVHRLDVVTAAERYGFVWYDRAEVIFKALPPDMPAPDPEAFDRLQTPQASDPRLRQTASDRQDPFWV